MGTQSLTPKGAEPHPISHVYCGQTAACIKMLLGMEVGLNPGDFVLHGDPAPSSKRGQSLQFSAHVYCGQTAAWIKIPLGTEVGRGPDDNVLDGDPAPSPKRARSPLSPIFSPCLLWPNGWMHQDATWYGGRPQPRGLCVTWGPSPLPKRRWSPGAEPPISAHVYCDQTAGWIKMPLGTKVGLSLGDFV